MPSDEVRRLETQGSIDEAASDVFKSEYFDTEFYRKESGVSGDRLSLVQHYLAAGEKSGLRPSLGFEPKFYTSTNKDLKNTRIQPLSHYIANGKVEARYTCAQDLERDAALVKRSGLIDNHVDIEAHLLGWRFGVRKCKDFDDHWYKTNYKIDGVVPIIHFIKTGKTEGFVGTKAVFDNRKTIIKPAFSPSYYAQRYRLDDLSDDELLENFMNAPLSDDKAPSPDFSTSFYLDLYPDLRSDLIYPLVHYLAHGLEEGREGAYSAQRYLRNGKMVFDRSKPTILVAVHESSRTGAPLLGWAIGRHLSEAYNVVFSIGRGGALLEAFARYSFLYSIGNVSADTQTYELDYLRTKYKLSAIIANSVEAAAIIAGGAQTNLPVLALIHEFAGYTFPRGRLASAVRSADVAIFPAAIVAEAAQHEIKSIYGAEARHVYTRVQGRLRDLPATSHAPRDMVPAELREFVGAQNETIKLILSAGAVQIRKGVDIFVQTAAEVVKRRQDVRFVWVGHGYDPDRDPAYSIWVKEMIDRLDLSQYVFFVPEQQDLETIFAETDIFFLSSRIDPFPNVAIDALCAGKHVVCFDRASGVAECLKEHPDLRGAVVEHCSPSAAAHSIDEALRDGSYQKSDIRIAACASSIFNFDAYISFLLEKVAEAGATKLGIVDEQERRKRESEHFDVSFYSGRQHPSYTDYRSKRDYIIGSVKRLHNLNPRAGFSENLARSRAENSLATTHRCVDLESIYSTNFTTLRFAVHVHLHYGELAASIEGLLSGSQVKMDVFITVTSALAATEASYAFRHFSLGHVDVHLVANRGRDVGPMLQKSMEERLSRYEVFLHIHGKKSIAIDASMGDRWRSFLLGTLVGKQNLAKCLSLFETDGLGLLFAEDRHNVGWGDNLVEAEALASRLMPVPKLPAGPYFPLGTMFMARPKVISALWALDLADKDYPVEPVATDGTIMHAFERILPAVCESQGLAWCTVRDPEYVW